jgi:hypothetical protein
MESSDEIDIPTIKKKRRSPTKKNRKDVPEIKIKRHDSSKKKEKRRLRKKIRKDKNITEYNKDEIDYIQTPIGKSTYKEPKQEKKKAHWSDKVLCEICGKTFTRSARSNHRATQYHKIYESMNKKLSKFLIDN